jgi:hypothetical protein
VTSAHKKKNDTEVQELIDRVSVGSFVHYAEVCVLTFNGRRTHMCVLEVLSRGRRTHICVLQPRPRRI